MSLTAHVPLMSRMSVYESIILESFFRNIPALTLNYSDSLKKKKKKKRAKYLKCLSMCYESQHKFKLHPFLPLKAGEEMGLLLFVSASLKRRL